MAGNYRGWCGATSDRRRTAGAPSATRGPVGRIDEVSDPPGVIGELRRVPAATTSAGTTGSTSAASRRAERRGVRLVRVQGFHVQGGLTLIGCVRKRGPLAVTRNGRRVDAIPATVVLEGERLAGRSIGRGACRAARRRGRGCARCARLCGSIRRRDRGHHQREQGASGEAGTYASRHHWRCTVGVGGVTPECGTRSTNRPCAAMRGSGHVMNALASAYRGDGIPRTDGSRGGVSRWHGGCDAVRRLRTISRCVMCAIC
jgi:hypothetical protein